MTTTRILNYSLSKAIALLSSQVKARYTLYDCPRAVFTDREHGP